MFSIAAALVVLAGCVSASPVPQGPGGGGGMGAGGGTSGGGNPLCYGGIKPVRSLSIYPIRGTPPILICQGNPNEWIQYGDYTNARTVEGLRATAEYACANQEQKDYCVDFVIGQCDTIPCNLPN